jgi:hypothetical protein
MPDGTPPTRAPSSPAVWRDGRPAWALTVAMVAFMVPLQGFLVYQAWYADEVFPPPTRLVPWILLAAAAALDLLVLLWAERYRGWAFRSLAEGSSLSLAALDRELSPLGYRRRGDDLLWRSGTRGRAGRVEVVTERSLARSRGSLRVPRAASPFVADPPAWARTLSRAVEGALASDPETREEPP